MNQHITKLVRQALKESVSTPVESVIASSIDGHGIVEIPNTFAEEFAELIVLKCADICMEMAAKCAGLEGDGALAKDCAYWIKKDFGVKE